MTAPTDPPLALRGGWGRPISNLKRPSRGRLAARRSHEAEAYGALICVRVTRIIYQSAVVGPELDSATAGRQRGLGHAGLVGIAAARVDGEGSARPGCVGAVVDNALSRIVIV